MEMTVGESLLGGFSAAYLFGADIEELARRALGSRSELERCYWEFWDFFRRTKGLGRGFDLDCAGVAEECSADREVSLRDRGANVSFDEHAALMNYSAVLENIASNAAKTRGGEYFGYMAKTLSDNVFGGYERDIFESFLNFGNGEDNSERSVWFNGADKSGYLSIMARAEDLYYGLGGAESGLPAPPDIAFEAVSWNSSSMPGFENVDNRNSAARTGLMSGEETWVASPLPRMIGSSGVFYNYGDFDMPRISREEIVSLRSSAARGGSEGMSSENAQMFSADGGSGFFGGDASYAADVRDAFDFDDMIDYLASSMKTALESGAEGVHS